MDESGSRARYRARATRFALLLVGAGGLGGCFYGESGELEQPEQFCGVFYACGSDSEPEESSRSSNRSSSTSEPPADPPPSSDPPPESGSPSDPEPPTNPG